MAEKDIVVCSSLLPISNAILKYSGVVDSTSCHEEDYVDCFMLSLSNPRGFWKERMTDEEFEIYKKQREFNLIKDDFDNLDEKSYTEDEEYRKYTLNLLFEEKINTLKNL